MSQSAAAPNDPRGLRRCGEERLAPEISVVPLRSPTLPPATHTNCYLLGERALTVVDPAAVRDADRGPLEVALEARLASGARVERVFLTHHHRDHIGSAAWVAERYQCPIVAHAESARRLPELSISSLESEGLEIDGALWSALWTPGHAPGHLCLINERSGDAVVGDMVAGVGTILIEPEEGDMAAYLESLRTLAALPLSRLLPAHGPPLSPAREALEGYIAHRLAREAKIFAALPSAPRERIGLAELVEIAYADAPAAVRVGADGGLAGYAARAHLEKLRREGRASADGEGLWGRSSSAE